MKKALLPKLISALLILSVVHLQGQSDNQKKSGHELSISNFKMNVLYVGVDNPLQIVVSGIDDKDVQVTFDGPGTLTRDTSLPHFYNAYVTATGKCEIRVSAKINGRITDIGSRQFRMKYIPDAVPMTTGHMEGGAVSAENMKTQAGLTCMLKGFDFDCRLHIDKYTMVFISGGKIFKAQATSAAFTPQMQQYLKQAKPGDAFFFEDINVIGPANQLQKLSQLSFYII
jgi:hypothetical protein